MRWHRAGLIAALTLLLCVGSAWSQGLGDAMRAVPRPQPSVQVSYAVDIRDDDDPTPHWAEHSTYATEGQAMVAARGLKAGGYRTRIRTVRVQAASPKSYVLWVRDPEAQVKNWKDGGRFDTRGEAVAAERAAIQAGLETNIGESQNGRTSLPPIRVATKKKRALLYQVMVYEYRNLAQGDWVVAYETFDPGAANERAIQIRSNQDPLPRQFYGPGHEYHPQTPVRVSSKEVLVDEETYRKSFPEYRP